MQVEDEVSSVGDFEPLVPVGQALLLVLLQFIEESGQVYDDPIAWNTEIKYRIFSKIWIDEKSRILYIPI